MTQSLAIEPKPVASRGAWATRYLHEILLGLLLILVLVGFGSLDRDFLDPQTQMELAGRAWPLVLLALPMTLIILTGGIDLSVGAATALCTVVLGLAIEAQLPTGVAIALALLTGAVAGAVNGTMVAVLRVHPLIVTLATLAGFRGIALALTGGRTIKGFPAGYGEIVAGEFLRLPYPLWFLLLAFIATAAFLSLTSYGRFIYAIGYNATAARYSGVPVRLIKFSLYTLSGLCAGIAAVLLTSRYLSAKADLAKGLELNVITAVVLGGVSIFGGRGHVVGVLLGVILIHECQQFVSWRWHKDEVTALVVGALLIGSVLVHSLRVRTRGRR